MEKALSPQVQCFVLRWRQETSKEAVGWCLVSEVAGGLIFQDFVS